MKTTKSVIVFVISNLFIMACILGMNGKAQEQINSPAIPLYGDWQETTGRVLNESNILQQEIIIHFLWNYSQAKITTDGYYLTTETYYGFDSGYVIMQFPDGAVRLEPDPGSNGGYVIPANLTFERSALHLSTSDANYTIVRYGTIDQTNHNGVNDSTNINLQPIVDGSYLNLTLTMDKPLLGNFIREVSYDWDYNTHSIDVDTSWPVLYCNNSNVHFSYVETWKYTPVVGYDNSTVLAGLQKQSDARTLGLSLVVGDCLIVPILFVFWFESRKAESGPPISPVKKPTKKPTEKS